MVWRSIKNSALVSDEKLETIADHDYDDFQLQRKKNTYSTKQMNYYWMTILDPFTSDARNA